MQKKGRGLSLRRVLRRSWGSLSIAFVAVMIEGATDLLDPWPLKLVFDSVVASKPAPRWFAGLASSIFGGSQQALLHLCALAVLAIAVVGAVASYIEKYLTTSVGQRVMHDLRRTLYHHIHRLSLSCSAIERGTHSDLVRLGGLYPELYETELQSGESSERSYGRREEERRDPSNFKRGPALAGTTE